MFRKKGQAAMEFLMTYGWAILVVIAVIAVLAGSGVLNVSSLKPEKCSMGASTDGITCVGTPVVQAEEGVIVLTLHNALAESVNFTNVTVSRDCSLGAFELCDDYNNCNAVDAAKDVDSDADFLVKLNCTETLSGSVDADITLHYVDDLSVPHEVEGSILGKAK